MFIQLAFIHIKIFLYAFINFESQLIIQNSIKSYPYILKTLLNTHNKLSILFNHFFITRLIIFVVFLYFLKSCLKMNKILNLIVKNYLIIVVLVFI